MTATTVLIVNYDSGPRLRACLRSVHSQAPSPAEVLVIDNASSDDSLEGLPAATRVLRRPTNEGFGAALGHGLATSESPFVLTLNPDTLVLPGCLAAAEAALAADSSLGCVALRVLQSNAPDRIDACGIGLTSTLGQINHHHGLLDDDIGDAPEIVLGPLGGAALWRREALTQIGGFATHYFLYWEDVDVALRLLHAGWGCRTVPGARVLHEGSGIVGKWSTINVFYMVRNHGLCLVSSLPGPLLRHRLGALVVAPLRAAVLYTLRGKPLAALGGLLCGLGILPRALIARRRLSALGDAREAAGRLARLMAAADTDRLRMRASRTTAGTAQ